jgi:hypothetical protein
LEYTVSKNGLKMDLENLKAIVKWLVLRSTFKVEVFMVWKASIEIFFKILVALMYTSNVHEERRVLMECNYTMRFCGVEKGNRNMCWLYQVLLKCSKWIVMPTKLELKQCLAKKVSPLHFSIRN